MGVTSSFYREARDREILEVDSDVVGLWVSREPLRGDCIRALQSRPENAVHSIHHSFVLFKQNWVRRIRVQDQARVLKSRPAGW